MPYLQTASRGELGVRGGGGRVQLQSDGKVSLNLRSTEGGSGAEQGIHELTFTTVSKLTEDISEMQI